MKVLHVALIYFLFLMSPGGEGAQELPKPASNSCQFYRELEDTFHCQKQGVNYLSDYAPFYCEEFKNKGRTWGPDLQKWTEKTRLCLQESLHESLTRYSGTVKVSCQKLEEMAFKIHSRCYNEADLCALRPTELFKVLRIIKFKDYFRELRYSDGGMIRLMNACLHEYLF